MKKWIVLSLCSVFVLAIACRKDEVFESPEQTPYVFEIPQFFPPIDVPANNPTTVEGVELGRQLFYDERLSASNTQACASCHAADYAFSDSVDFSVGIDNVAGDRNAMPIINLAWNTSFFWDGRSATLEEQALEPVVNPIEMHQGWRAAATKIAADSQYPSMFYSAFGTSQIDSAQITKALAQFMRTLISGESRYDKFLRGETLFTPEELQGFDIFNTERGDCFHCHGGVLFTTQIFSNNGLDVAFTDDGLGGFTGDGNDDGKFKVPTLRNISLTGPYMHDGRFATLEEVIDHYSTGVVWSPTIDPNMKKVAQGGLQLTPMEKSYLKAFLMTLVDPDFIANPAHQDPAGI